MDNGSLKRLCCKLFFFYWKEFRSGDSLEVRQIFVWNKFINETVPTVINENSRDDSSDKSREPSVQVFPLLTRSHDKFCYIYKTNRSEIEKKGFVVSQWLPWWPSIDQRSAPILVRASHMSLFTREEKVWKWGGFLDYANIYRQWNPNVSCSPDITGSYTLREISNKLWWDWRTPRGTPLPLRVPTPPQPTPLIVGP